MSAARAWVISRVDVPLGYARDAEGCLEWVLFTDDNLWRFPDRASAERVVNDRCLLGVDVQEHEWTDP